jgi:ribosomal protein L12E/L44/L45/RPP1/RPP2
MRRRRRRRVLLVGGLVAFGAYKLSTRDAKRVEEHTGVAPEEMTDEELERAMNDLGIEKQMRDADDVEQGAAAAQAPAASQADELRKLAQLRDEGVLTEEEFDAQKQQLLGL